MTPRYLAGVCLWLVLSWSVVSAQETFWSGGLTFTHDQVEVQLLNWELTRDKQTLLVHAKLKSVSRSGLYFYWKDLFRAESASGSSKGSNFDALVDRNGAGLTRTVAEFQLAPRERARITIPFLLNEDDLPLRLVLPDGRRSVLIE